MEKYAAAADNQGLSCRIFFVGFASTFVCSAHRLYKRDGIHDDSEAAARIVFCEMRLREVQGGGSY